jgi:hypothetical protein
LHLFITPSITFLCVLRFYFFFKFFLPKLPFDDLVSLEFVISDGERKRLQMIAISTEGGGRANRERA